MSECKYYQELISRMLDKDLSKRERAAVMEHLDSCSECAAMYEAFSMLSNNVSANLAEPPEELTEDIMANIHRSEMIRKNHKTSRQMKTVIASAACAAVLIAVVGGFSIIKNLRKENVVYEPRLSQSNISVDPASGSTAADGMTEAAVPGTNTNTGTQNTQPPIQFGETVVSSSASVQQGQTVMPTFPPTPTPNVWYGNNGQQTVQAPQQPVQVQQPVLIPQQPVTSQAPNGNIVVLHPTPTPAPNNVTIVTVPTPTPVPYIAEPYIPAEPDPAEFPYEYYESVESYVQPEESVYGKPVHDQSPVEETQAAAADPVQNNEPSHEEGSVIEYSGKPMIELFEETAGEEPVVEEPVVEEPVVEEPVVEEPVVEEPVVEEPVVEEPVVEEPVVENREPRRIDMTDRDTGRFIAALLGISPESAAAAEPEEFSGDAEFYDEEFAETAEIVEMPASEEWDEILPDDIDADRTDILLYNNSGESCELEVRLYGDDVYLIFDDEKAGMTCLFAEYSADTYNTALDEFVNGSADTAVQLLTEQN